MVEFCRQCGGSLARGDLTFWMGEMFTSADYLCPFCGKHAHPDAPKADRPAPPAPDADTDLVFRKGKAETQAPPPENG
jgi:hypothetical protein